MKNRLIWRLYPSYLLVTILSIAAVLLYTSTTVERYDHDRAITSVTETGSLVKLIVEQHLQQERVDQLDSLLQSVQLATGDAIVILDRSLRVIASTEDSLRQIRDYSDYSEITRAQRGEQSFEERYHASYDGRILYFAIPILRDGAVTYIIRVAHLLPESRQFMNTLRRNLALAAAIVALLAAVISYLISRLISKPLEDIREGAERFAGGELGYKLPVRGSTEMKSLSRAMNEMASQLDDRLRTVIRQRNEQQAILASLVEGVLAVNRKEEIISVNQGAERLLGIREAEARGRSIQEVIRNSDLQTLVSRTLTLREPTEGMIVLENAGEKHFQGYTSILQDSEGEMLGALVVLNDLTRVRRLENLRRDFVANVSHELKTPITTIKGFVETLIDGAAQRPEETRRFLAIISKQVDRLNSIIEDLLNLSWIEQEAGKGGIERENYGLYELLQACVEACEIARKEKEINISINCPEHLRANINAHLLEQAVINLVDNAIKYSDYGKTVTITAGQNDDETMIAVRDEGSGIAPEHLPRLFERFYRVDKARSRKLGGTGLGLSIVKHIVLAHGGTVDVTSELAKGTTFTIRLPRVETKEIARRG